MKNELSGKIMTQFVALRPKTYSYLTDHKTENKKSKDAKMCVIQRKFKFEDCRTCLEATQLDNKANYLENIKYHADNLKNHKEFTKYK